MAQIHPFAAYRYSSFAGSLNQLVTQPYDKISLSMQARYLALSPYNFVRIILGERYPADGPADNAYTRARRHLDAWVDEGIFLRDSAPSVYAYTQEFSSPDSGGTLTRKGFIALGDVENYDARVVHRHEQTLAGPKKDRLELLRHTHAHFGQIFMLYGDPDLAVDRLLDEACLVGPTSSVTDEFDTTHRLWRLSSPTLIDQIQQLMSDKKLLIADGHHRYETALAFRNENPDLPGARQVMMTFVNMHSPGLKILATHRVVSNLPSFDAATLLERTGARPLDSMATLKQFFSLPAPWPHPHWHCAAQWRCSRNRSPARRRRIGRPGFASRYSQRCLEYR